MMRCGPVMLNDQQSQQFHTQGYLVLESVFSKQDIAALKRAALEVVADFDSDKHRTVFSTKDQDTGRDDYFFDSAEAVHCFLEEGALGPGGELTRPKELAINKIGHAMHDLMPEFSAFCRLPEIGEALRDIGYEQPHLWQTMYIFKQPKIGGEVRWHQDASYLSATGSPVTGVWVAIEDATQENGCLWMQPGQHRSALREIYQVDWQTRIGTLENLDKMPWCGNTPAEPLEVRAGSMVLFHDHMPHYSSTNYSTSSRHAFTMHVAEHNAHWSKNNWLQRPQLGNFEL